jgi:glycosyltransferase involved in cell wall biosynthesis
MKLSILICHLPERKKLLHRLSEVLNPQLGESVEVLVAADSRLTVGEKRNTLLHWATGDYVAFVDDDDIVSSDYVELLMNGINEGVDCCSLLGQITFDGKNPELFEHSIKYDKWETVEGARIKYVRYPNHLSCIKASIARQFKFPNKSHGEDHDWSTQLHKSGLLKTEHYIPKVIYYYQWQTK